MQDTGDDGDPRAVQRPVGGLAGWISSLYQRIFKPQQAPSEIFEAAPDVASRHSVDIAGVRYVGFRPKGDGPRPISFRGLPFAASTAGAGRLAPPAPFETQADEIDCTRYGPACWQDPVGLRLIHEGLGVIFKEMLFPSSKPGFSKTYGRFGEDCLNLNLWTPALDGARRAVMVWIHGGAFKSGSNIELGLYDGAHLSLKGDVVVVSINYRFGLWALHMPEEGITNLSLQDQIFALKWVRDHSEAFGGDPDNVTLFGESAGGISVANLLASPEAKGLFHKAISQSGGALSLSGEEFGRIFEAASEAFKGERGDAPLGAGHLRGIGSPQALLKRSDKIEEALGEVGSAKIGFLPLRDGKYVDSEGALRGIAAGRGSKVPLLIGSNAQEMQLFSAAFGPLFPRNIKALMSGLRQARDLTTEGEAPETTQALETEAEALVKAFTPIVEARTGAAPKRKAVIEAALTFVGFTLDAYELASAQATVNGGEVYNYRFGYGSAKYGACHGIDLHFLWNFGAPYEAYFCERSGLIPDHPEDARIAALADAMQRAWIAFAKTGAPSAIQEQAWPPFPSRMNLNLASHVDTWEGDAELRAWLETTGAVG